ncbi:MAG: SDR family oxidoreductase [Deltaproteobacteria bacterium]|nr:SDR family oxidoreductase [Deltaproteobacteria bacterium]
MGPFNSALLEGKVALITGGGRGIGRASALALADAGADVVVSSRTVPELEKVAEEIRAKGRKGLAVACDLSKIEELQNLVDKVKEALGRIDILVNNVGGPADVTYLGPAVGAPQEGWDKVMNLNLKIPFFLSTLVAPIMKEQQGGSIINIGALAGMKAVEGGAMIYGIAKAGMISMTWSLAKELGKHNIRVNIISPGVVKTKMTDFFLNTPEREESFKNRLALRCLGEPNDIAAAVVFLASDQSKWTTGANLVIDGGSMVGP